MNFYKEIFCVNELVKEMFKNKIFNFLVLCVLNFLISITFIFIRAYHNLKIIFDSLSGLIRCYLTYINSDLKIRDFRTFSLLI